MRVPHSFIMIMSLTLAACSSPTRQSLSASATPQEHSDSVLKTMQDYLNQENSPSEKTLLSWVSDQDLSQIQIPDESFYSSSDEDNYYVVDLENNLSIKSTISLTQDSFLILNGRVISTSDTKAEKLFTDGKAMVCEISKSTTSTLTSQTFQLAQTTVNDGNEFHLLDLQWSSDTGASIQTRCLSRQPIKLGDLKFTLQNLFAVTLNKPQ